jgi:hypothetical protein
MYPDQNNGLFAHIQTLSTTAGKYEARLMLLGYTSPGTLVWQLYMFSSANMYSPVGRGGITTDPTGANQYAYSCIVMQGTVTQTYMKKVAITTGILQALVELKSINANGCQVHYHTSTGRVLLIISYSTGLT